MSEIRSFAEIADDQAEQVGGKGLSLGRMARAGLPVPPGFCLTADAFRRCSGRTLDATLTEALLRAYRELGEGPVAVRSSATAEDSEAASFAGQQETLLGIEGGEALCRAVERCWHSLHSERALAYRQKRGVAETMPAMAVVVQRLVAAEVAGVLFTSDPTDPTGTSMLIEASYGLGESVVSGRVTPDRFRVARLNGEVLQRHLGQKSVVFTPQGEQPVPLDRQAVFCLSDAQLQELAALGRQVEAFYGAPRDVEWALADGRFWLLQARPITTASAAEREQVRLQEIAQAKQNADPSGTVWVRYNLSESLPTPTPMTWSILRVLLTGGGGFGAMQRDFGGQPDPALHKVPVFDLIAGRPYCNLNRLPRLQYLHPPYEYPFAELKAAPETALDPKPVMRPLRDGVFKGLLRLPGLLLQMSRIAKQTERLSETFADTFRRQIIPPFAASARAALQRDRSNLVPVELVAELIDWQTKTLIDFAKDSLKPTLLADAAWQRLAAALTPTLGAERTRSALGELALGAKPDPEADLASALSDLTKGRRSHAMFLQQFGHRGSHEMELAEPRWSENPASLDRLLVGSTLEAIQVHSSSAGEKWSAIATEAKLSSSQRESLRLWVDRLQTYLGLRETGKHYLMLGYAVLRQILVELDRRFDLQGDIWFLTLEELPKLIAKEDLSETIQQRQKYRQLALSLEVPPVLFSDDLEAIGRPLPEPQTGQKWQGAGLSSGVAEGPALVLREPTAAPQGEPYILVCPSTDPAWVPLFLHAKGLVMETGGVLSHGAIVAREFGLPAVAGLSDVTQQIRSGQRLRIDGAKGLVVLLES